MARTRRRRLRQLLTAPKALPATLAGRLALGLIAAVLVGGLAAGLTVGLSGPTPPTSFGYRIVYRVVTNVGRPTLTTEILEARRPFLVSDVTRAGAPPGGAVQGGQVSDGGFFLLSATNGRVTAEQLGADTAEPNSTDLRLQPALTVAAAAGLVRAAGADQLLGLSCTNYLSENPLDGGSWGPPTKSSRVSSCVTHDGFLLRETWSLNGKLVRSRTAVTFVRTRAAFHPLRGFVRKASNLPPNEVAVPLAHHAAPMLVRVPHPPAGLVLVRALRVTEFESSSLSPVPVAVDRRLVYTDGNNVVTLTERNLLSPSAGQLSSGSVPVSVGTLGSGRLSPGPGGLTVIIRRGGTGEIDVEGTLPETPLLAWIRSLRLV